jgi:putative copper export protein
VDLAAALIAVRFALYLDLMLVFGLPLFALYTVRKSQRQGWQVISAGTLCALSLSGAALSALGLFLLAATMSDVAVSQLDGDTLRALLDGTAIGSAGKVRVAALYQVSWLLTQRGDSQGGHYLIQHRRLWEVCDGVGGWASGRF